MKEALERAEALKKRANTVLVDTRYPEAVEQYTLGIKVRCLPEGGRTSRPDRSPIAVLGLLPALRFFHACPSRPVGIVVWRSRRGGGGEGGGDVVCSAKRKVSQPQTCRGGGQWRFLGMLVALIRPLKSAAALVRATRERREGQSPLARRASSSSTTTT